MNKQEKKIAEENMPIFLFKVLANPELYDQMVLEVYEYLRNL
jgi:hypothetical protein